MGEHLAEVGEDPAERLLGDRLPVPRPAIAASNVRGASMCITVTSPALRPTMLMSTKARFPAASVVGGNVFAHRLWQLLPACRLPSWTA